MALLDHLRRSQSAELSEQVFQERAVEVAEGVAKGVKILGAKSLNGRRYSDRAMDQAASLYEGVKVNINHPARRPADPRDYRDRFGALRNVRREPNGLYGDLHYNPKHPLAEQFAWDAENAPENVGLSHNANGRVKRVSGEVVVEAIEQVRSVDIVADPATNQSLFESEQPAMTNLRSLIEATDYAYMSPLLEMLPDSVDPAAPIDMPPEDGMEADPVLAVKSALADEAVKIFLDPAIDPAETGRKIKDLAKAADDVANKVNPAEAAPEPNPEADDDDEEKVIESVLPESAVQQIASLQESVATLVSEREARKFLGLRNISEQNVGPERFAALTECDDEAARAKLVESWPPVLRGARRPQAETVSGGSAKTRPRLAQLRGVAR